VLTILFASLNAAPPHVEDASETNVTEETADMVQETTTAAAAESTEAEVSTEAPVTSTTTIKPVELLSGKERYALIGHLGNVDLKKVDKLILTPRQQLAISQEIELLGLGLPPFHDPNAWERLTKEEQILFNEKYLALSPDLQEFAKTQFLSSPEDILIHAFRMFINLDLATLSQVLQRETQSLQQPEDTPSTAAEFKQAEVRRLKARRRLVELPRSKSRAAGQEKGRRRINIDPRRNN